MLSFSVYAYSHLHPSLLDGLPHAVKIIPIFQWRNLRLREATDRGTVACLGCCGAWDPLPAQKRAVWGHRTEAEPELPPPVSRTVPRQQTSSREESPYQESSDWAVCSTITWQPELLQEGDEALKHAVDPVHCSETRGDVSQDGDPSRAPGSGSLPAAPGPRHAPRKQSPNMQF